jgi:aryl-alcohol dehydrogenase-like predicted oxidoreductase
VKRESQTFVDKCHLSRLMLGTVQFGLDSGGANRAGQPAYNTAREILACAIEHGINCFDTAAAYGGSEAVLGRALRELGVRDRVTVVTKVPPLPAGLNGLEARAMIETSVRQSMQRLGLDVLPLCLFHR